MYQFASKGKIFFVATYKIKHFMFDKQMIFSERAAKLFY